MMLLSTPYGKWGFFYDEWHGADPSWSRHRVPATGCPRISPEFLEQERRALGDDWYRQEYLCEFVDAARADFPRETIDRAFTDEIQPLQLGI